VDYIVTADFDRPVVGECLTKEPALSGYRCDSVGNAVSIAVVVVDIDH
jgi:hypothetical protein